MPPAGRADALSACAFGTARPVPVPNGTAACCRVVRANATTDRWFRDKGLAQPALLLLRLRALFGTGARADVIATLLAYDTLDVSVAEVSQLGYTKRNIANVLSALEAAGLLVSHRVQNHLRYRWAKRAALVDLVQPLPKTIPAWRRIVDLMAEMYWFVERTEPKASVVRNVEAAKILPRTNQLAASLNWRGPGTQRHPEGMWDDLARWEVKLARSLAGGSMQKQLRLSWS